VEMEGVAADLGRLLNSIEAIAYYVEMTLPASELNSRQYLRKVQLLVHEADGILDGFAQKYTGAGSVANSAQAGAEAIEAAREEKSA